jgi:hypothetical protein
VKSLIGFFYNRGLIVPSKEKKKDKRSSSLIRKLGRSKTGSVVSQSQNAPGLVGLLETMRVQLEVYFDTLIVHLIFQSFYILIFAKLLGVLF